MRWTRLGDGGDGSRFREVPVCDFRMLAWLASEAARPTGNTLQN